MTIVWFVIALGILVFLHEFGHFLAAKKQGIGVEKFSLGFGPKLAGFRRGETEYRISALPLGGYVELSGEDPDSEGATDAQGYAGRPIRQRFGVVFAGPFMNLILALFLMPVVFGLGRPEPAFLTEAPVVMGVRSGSPAGKAGLKRGDRILGTGEESFASWRDLLGFVILHGGREVTFAVDRGGKRLENKVTIEDRESEGGYLGIEPIYFLGNDAVVDGVSPGSPADEAGIKAGDEILRIEGVPVEGWTGMSEQVQASGGKRIRVTLQRGGQTREISVAPRHDASLDRWLLGVKKDLEAGGMPTVMRRYSPGQAVREGFRENIRLAGLTLSVLKRLVTLDLSYKTLGGPVRIAQAAGHAARSSAADFLYFIAFLSLQLGILNLLPIPVLDGGHLLFLGLEGLFRRPVHPRIRLAFEQAGFVFLMLLMVLITVNDVDSVWGIRHLIERVWGLF